MNNIIIWIIIATWSIVFGILKMLYSNRDDTEIRGKSIYVINEIWNHTISIFLGGIIIYYLISIRYPLVVQKGNIELLDLILLFVVAMCLLGMFPYFIRNLTEGISGIIKKALK